MSSADVPKIDEHKTENGKHQTIERNIPPSMGPVPDVLGVAFVMLRLAICTYVMFGWTIPHAPALMFYLVFLPLVAMQWLVNRGARVMGNFETFLRTGRWRDPEALREGRLISSLAFWVLRRPANSANIDLMCFGALFGLWLLGFLHLSALGDPGLLSLFP